MTSPNLSLLFAAFKQYSQTVFNPAFWIPFLVAVKIIGLILTVIFFIGIIILTIRSNLLAEKWQEAFYLIRGGYKIKNRFSRQWQRVYHLLDEKSETYWKLAMAEADKIFDQFLIAIGYSGKNPEERLENIRDYQIPTIEDIKKTHQFIREVLKNPNSKISYEEARDAVMVYENALKELEAI